MGFVTRQFGSCTVCVPAAHGHNPGIYPTTEVNALTTMNDCVKAVVSSVCRAENSEKITSLAAIGTAFPVFPTLHQRPMVKFFTTEAATWN